MSLDERLNTLLNNFQTIITNGERAIRRTEQMLSQSAYLCKQLDKHDQGAISSSPPTLKRCPLAIIRCSKCQGLGHSFSDCANQEIVTLAEWTAMIEEETQEEEKKEKKTSEEENQRMCSMVVHEEDVEKTETPSKLHKHTPPHTFPDKPGAPTPTKPIQMSLFPILYTPSFKVLQTCGAWKILAQPAWKTQPFEDQFFEWLIMVYGLSTALIDHQD